MLISLDSDDELFEGSRNRKTIRNSVPRITSKKVDLTELRDRIAEGSKEMD